MKVLALDSSGLVATVAVAEEERLIAEATLCNRLTHSQVLMPMVEQALRNAELSLPELDAVAVAVGPGSFTGLRIGIATAKALAMAIGKPLLPVGTLDALAANLPFATGLVCPIMDARRNQVYTAAYRSGLCLLPPAALGLEALCDWLRTQPEGESSLFLGDGVAVHAARLRELLAAPRFAPPAHSLQRAALVAQLGLEQLARGEGQDPMQVDALYLRSSQAQEAPPKFANLGGL